MYGVSTAPNVRPNINAIPGRSKKNRLETTPANQVQIKKISIAANPALDFRRSRGSTKCKIAIKAMPDNKHPKAVECGASGGN